MNGRVIIDKCPSFCYNCAQRPPINEEIMESMDTRRITQVLRHEIALHQVIAGLNDEQRKAPDPTVGIYIYKLVVRPVRFIDGQIYMFYAARVEPGKWVKPHFHMNGPEPYVIWHGLGEMNTRLWNDDSGLRWLPPESLNVGQQFIVREGYVHCMRNVGDVNLDFGFVCPLDHLNDADRFMTPDLPPHFPK